MTSWIRERTEAQLQSVRFLLSDALEDSECESERTIIRGNLAAVRAEEERRTRAAELTATRLASTSPRV